MEDYMKKYGYWLSDPYFDEDTKKELRAIGDDRAGIEDRFYKDLEFGTGGLRGVIGAGSNRMNVYTVRRATQGLANYIIKQGTREKGVAIAFDSRRMSSEFGDVAALCLAANGIKAFIFESLRPTPELSFALRELGCTAGIVITASHNPAEYNGYKVYWDDGCQVTPPRDGEIIAEVNAVENYSDSKTMDREAARVAGLYNVIGYEMDDKYIAQLKKYIIHPEIIREAADSLKIVYTPFHGTGNIPVRRILKELGFKHVYVVEEQEKPDPDFTTVPYPNPEVPEAYELALKLAGEKGADIILATDPDADRLGIYAYDSVSGKYIPFTGNMSAILIAEYRIRELQKLGMLPENGAVVRTIVSSNMIDPIAARYGLDVAECLTGFKFIGERIGRFERENSHEYVFGYEESYGCLVGKHARDKDAPCAVMCLAEVAAWCRKNGITVWDQMINIYKEYGFYREGIHTLTLKGVNGAGEIGRMMDRARSNPPGEFAGLKVREFRDYSKDIRINYETGEKGATGLPRSNVLYFDLDNDSWCCVRPSGTEPKIKFYMGVKGDSLQDSETKIEELKADVIKKLAN